MSSAGEASCPMRLPQGCVPLPPRPSRRSPLLAFFPRPQSCTGVFCVHPPPGFCSRIQGRRARHHCSTAYCGSSPHFISPRIKGGALGREWGGAPGRGWLWAGGRPPPLYKSLYSAASKCSSSLSLPPPTPAVARVFPPPLNTAFMCWLRGVGCPPLRSLPGEARRRGPGFGGVASGWTKNDDSPGGAGAGHAPAEKTEPNK